MGYTTRFTGSISLSRKLTLKEAKRWLDTCEEIYEGDVSLKPNRPDSGYLQWVPSESLDGIVWDEGEKFYLYAEWLSWVIDKLIKPWDITANGKIGWSGEDAIDTGLIEVVDNDVIVTTTDALKVSSHSPLTRIKLAEMAIESIGEASDDT